MEFKEFTAGPDDDGKKLVKIIRVILESKKQLSSPYSIIRKRLVKVNDKKTDETQIIRTNDKIKIASFLLEGTQENQPGMTDQDESTKTLEKITVFRNDHILITNKPSGMNVQKANGTDKALNQIVEEACTKKDNSLTFTPGPLNRIDRNTSGLVVFSQSMEGARWFSQVLQEHKVEKTYLGIILGKFGKLNIKTRLVNMIETIETSGRESKFQTVGVYSENTDGPMLKKAVTIITPLSYGRYGKKDITLCRFNIETGRKHQIRAQSSHAGYPLLFDTAYGAFAEKNRTFFLHAFRMTFPDNSLGVPESIECQPDENFIQFVKQSFTNIDFGFII